MHKFLKWLTIFVLGLIFLGVTGGFLLTHYVDPNHYKAKISEQVSDKIGRSFKINGNLQWSFFPWLGLQVNDVELGNASGFADAPFAKAGEIDIHVQLLPLLKRNINVGHLVLKNLELNLEKNAQGQANWQGLMAPAPGSTTVSARTDKKSTPVKIKIEAIDVLDGRVSFNDKQRQRTWVLSKFNLQSKNIQENEAFSLHAEGQLKSNQPALTGRVTLDTNINFDLSKQVFSLKPFQLVLQLQDKKFAGGELKADLSADINLNLKEQTLSVTSINSHIANLQMKGEFKGSDITRAPLVQGSVKIPEFQLKQFLQAVGAPVPVMQDPKALHRGAADLKINWSPSYLTVNVIAALFDDTNFSANVLLNSQNGNRMDAALDHIDLSRYLAPTNNQTPMLINNLQYQGSLSFSEKSDLTFLQQLQTAGRLRITSLKAANVSANNLAMNVSSKEGLIHLSDVKAQLYQGSYTGDIQLDARSKSPKFTLNQHFAKIQIEPLLKDLKTLTHLQMSGVADLNMQITAAGSDLVAMRRSLNGNLKFAMQNGVLKGVNIEYLLNLGTALLRKEPPPSNNTANQTQFGNLTGTATLTNGVLENKDFALQASFMRVLGYGKADLVNEQLDFHLNAVKMNTATGQAHSDVIPIKITGKFDQLSMRPDVEALIKTQAQKLLQKQTEKVQEKLGDQIGKHLGKDLGDQIKQLDISKILN